MIIALFWNNWFKVAQKWAAFYLCHYWKIMAFCPGVFPEITSLTNFRREKYFQKTIDKRLKLWYNKNIEKDRSQVHNKTGKDNQYGKV